MPKTITRRSQAVKDRPKEKRPSWDAYFMDLAYLVSRRATCLRRKVGAVIVKDRHILSTGYNGAPKNITHCEKTGCLRERLNIASGQRHELCRGLHAEQNAIIQAALHGVSVQGASLYCTNMPCSICAKMIINAGIKRLVISDGYADDMAKRFLKEARVHVVNIKNKRKTKI
jgi:dCMP deaminase